MNDDLNLSHLLETPPPPFDGPERVRKTVARRHRRNQIMAGTLGTFVMLVGGVGTTYAVTNGHGKKDVLLSRQASNSEPTTTTSTTSTTSTTIPDPHQRYVGIEHDMVGAGLPLGTSVQSWGGAMENYDYKVGATLYTWTRDKTGDMLWIERVTKALRPQEEYTPVNAKVLAVFDIAKPTKDEYFCLGSCAKGNKVDTSVIGLISGANGQEKSVKTWRVDVKALTFKEIETTGWKAYAQPDLPPLPARPELYNYLATANNDEFWRVTAEENVSSKGAGGGFIFVSDAKENKDVAVIQSGGGKGNVAVDKTPNGNFHTGNIKYKGEVNANVLVYIDRDPQSNDQAKVLHAWLVDRSTGTFTSVTTSDVTL